MLQKCSIARAWPRSLTYVFDTQCLQSDCKNVLIPPRIGQESNVNNSWRLDVEIWPDQESLAMHGKVLKSMAVPLAI